MQEYNLTIVLPEGEEKELKVSEAITLKTLAEEFEQYYDDQIILAMIDGKLRELKKIQDEFNAGKKERFNRINKETREQFKKYLKDTQETKKTIFDIEPKDETKIKYKDYLRKRKLIVQTRAKQIFSTT